MLRGHRLAKWFAGLVLGFGLVPGLNGAAYALEVPLATTAPYQLAVPPPSDGAAVTQHPAPPARRTHRDRAVGEIAKLAHNAVFVQSLANIPLKPGFLPVFGDVRGPDEIAGIEVVAAPLPRSVWLFLAALALLFGISRRRNPNPH